MAITQLNPAVEECIQLMHLRQADQEIIRQTVARYATPDSFSNPLTWIIYRTCNAVKSFFGVSDWEIAQRVIQDQAMEMAIERRLVQVNPQDDVAKRIKAEAMVATDRIGRALLEVCYEIFVAKLNTTDMLQPNLERLDLEIVIEQMQHAVDKLYPRSPKTEEALA